MRDVLVEAGPADLSVYADPMFGKIFYNLIDNTLKYGGGAITKIHISCHATDRGLVLICEDDGAGIAIEDKENLFEQGYGKHTGLGLFLSREILAITGITITETGEPGKGARFEMVVPKGAFRFTDEKGIDG
jgi:signal transduction histidine kinase